MGGIDLYDLSFLSEVGKSECGRTLIFLFILNTYKNKHDNCNDIRKHLNKLLSTKRKSGDKEVNYLKSAENYRAEYTEVRTPYCKNNKCDCEPSSVAEALI